jgi:hypothetical protein
MAHNFLFYPAVTYFCVKACFFAGLAYLAVVVRWLEKNRKPVEKRDDDDKYSGTGLEPGWYDVIV